MRASRNAAWPMFRRGSVGLLCDFPLFLCLSPASTPSSREKLFLSGNTSTKVISKVQCQDWPQPQRCFSFTRLSPAKQERGSYPNLQHKVRPVVRLFISHHSLTCIWAGEVRATRVSGSLLSPDAILLSSPTRPSLALLICFAAACRLSPPSRPCFILTKTLCPRAGNAHALALFIFFSRPHHRPSTMPQAFCSPLCPC
jgi:hypothetical protein